MTAERRQKRQLLVTAEVIIEVTDEAALEQAVLADIDAADFRVSENATAEQTRAAVREGVVGDPVAAVEWITDPGGLLPSKLPGVEIVMGTSEAVEVEVDEHGLLRPAEPHFELLFPPCRCAKDSCAACSELQLTPRTAAALWTAGQILVEQAYDDVQDHGDEPVLEEDEWAVFGRYPHLSRTQDAVWRRRAAQAYDDLTEDLEDGNWPRPRCMAEEIALHLILQDVGTAVGEGRAVLPESLERLPAHPDDFSWDLLHDILLQDAGVLDLFDADLDGIEDAEYEFSLEMAIGDYRPQSWFETFDGKEPRDGRRPFRR